MPAASIASGARAPALVALALLASAASLAVACRAERPLVRIGLVVPLSGRDASVGENILSAARLAIAEANEESRDLGPRFVLAAEDEATLPESLPVQARKLAADRHTVGVVGYLSQAAAVTPIFATADVPLLVLGTGPLPPQVASQGGPRLRLAPPEESFVQTTTQLVTERLRARRAAIARLAPPDSGSLLSRVTEGLRAAGVVVDPPVEEPAALRLVPPPEVILVAGPGVAAAETLIALRSRGYSGPLICIDGCDTPDFLKVAGDQAAGTLYLAAAPASRDRAPSPRAPRDAQPSLALPPPAGGSTNALDGEGDREPSQRLLKASPQAWPFAALAYDAVHLLATAARQSGTAPPRQAVKRALLSLSTPVEGATGPLIWDDQGHRRGVRPAVYEYAELRYPARLVD